MASYHFTVFEAVNDRLKEIFVGLTDAPMFETIDHLRHAPPNSIRHWNLDDMNTFRSVEFDLDKSSAEAFVRDYAKRTPPNGWRYLISHA